MLSPARATSAKWECLVYNNKVYQMLTVQKLQTLVTSANASSYALASFTPAQHSLLVAVVHAPGSISGPWSMSGAGSTDGWVRRSTSTFNSISSPSNAVMIFTAWQEATPVAMAPSFTCSGDPATGCLMALFQVTGGNIEGAGANAIGAITRVGGVPAVNISDGAANPLVYPGKVSNNSQASTTNTNNAYLIAIAAPRNPAAFTAPSGWTEVMDAGIAGPTSGLWIGTRVGGEASDVFTVVGASAPYAAHFLEFCAPGQYPS